MIKTHATAHKYYIIKNIPIYLNLHLFELLLLIKVVIAVPWIHPHVTLADLPDHLVPDSFANDDVLDRLVGLGKADDGVGVQEGQQILHQLWATPKLFLSTASHVFCKMLERVNIC